MAREAEPKLPEGVCAREPASPPGPESCALVGPVPWSPRTDRPFAACTGRAVPVRKEPDLWARPPPGEIFGSRPPDLPRPPERESLFEKVQRRFAPRQAALAALPESTWRKIVAS